MVTRAQVPEHIEIQDRRANDIKHSAPWEATQVFLEILLSMVQFFLLSVLSYVGLLFLSIIGIPFWMSTFRTLDRKYWGGSVHTEHCKSPESHNCTRGVFSYLRPWLNNFHFGSSLEHRDFGSQSRDIAKSRRLNVATSV